MTNKKKLAVIYGGKSGEHEISLLSAYSVINALDSDKYDILPIGIAKDGRSFVNDVTKLMAREGESLAVEIESSKPLDSLLVNGKFFTEVDVVFPAVHGPLYEDGALQGMLELAGCAYVGCSVLSSAVSMDKEMAKRMVEQLGIKTADYCLINAYSTKEKREVQCVRAAKQLGWPLFVKPVCMGSSVGINKASSQEELNYAVEEALRFDSQVLIEQYVEAQEIELAVLENKKAHDKPFVSDAGEIVVSHQDGFYSYTAKYIESESTSLKIPAAISKDVNQTAKNLASQVFVALKCSGMARVDLFVTPSGEIYFNEINTIPGFTQISMYPKLMQSSGFNYAQLLDELIELAELRQQKKLQLVTSYQ